MQIVPFKTIGKSFSKPIWQVFKSVELALGPQTACQQIVCLASFFGSITNAAIAAHILLGTPSLPF